MIKLVINSKNYIIRDYDISYKMPSSRSTVESYGGFVSVFTQYGKSKETYTLKTNFRKRDVYALFLNDLNSATKFDMYILNDNTNNVSKTQDINVTYKNKNLFDDMFNNIDVYIKYYNELFKKLSKI